LKLIEAAGADQAGTEMLMFKSETAHLASYQLSELFEAVMNNTSQ